MFVNPISNFNVTSNSYKNNLQGAKNMPSALGGGGVSPASLLTL